MDKKTLEKLCKFARLETHRRGEFAYCRKNKNGCVGNVWYPTGHSYDDSYIDSEQINSCGYRKIK